MSDFESIDIEIEASAGRASGELDKIDESLGSIDATLKGIANAVASNLVPLLQELVRSNQDIADKDVTLSIDSREIARASNNGQSKLGRPLVSFS